MLKLKVSDLLIQVLEQDYQELFLKLTIKKKAGLVTTGRPQQFLVSIQ